MSDRFTTLEGLDERQSAVLDEVMAGRGRLPTPFKVWIHSPSLAQRMNALGGFMTAGLSLTKREQEIVVLMTAVRLKATYVQTVHAIEAREAGFTDEVIQALSSGQEPHLSDARERAVYAAMAALETPDDPEREVFDRAVQALGRGGVAEMIALAGYYTSVALAMKFHAMKPKAS